ncbi:glycoside hydrolase domain-containing protein [Micromonospora sp. NBC_01796]|uniref:glycoside hydrolase domain-containing protein n=1 Tax=Micromonospora sp. NBC_01796 TaxID=2975987 RepID=UPI002DDC1E1C|nr:glycoside hydrolase domain-containing protein [Micromonospora sp. NBC_01796]
MNRIMAGLAALLFTIAGSSVAPVPVRAAVAENSSTSEDLRTVGYRGYRVTVPQTWRIVDLTDNQDACVRFDLPTVYLGHPGDGSSCPAHLVGRTAGLVVEPLEAVPVDRLPPDTATTAPGTAAPSAPWSRDDSLRFAVRDAGVLVTAAHTPVTEPLVRRILATATLGPDAKPAAPTALPGTGSAPGAGTRRTPLVAAGPQPGTYTGRGFDTCTAPSQSTMDTWRASSPYRAVGVYISGANRSCAQPNLTANWVSNQTANGWRLIPIELGRQAPCSTRYSLLMSSDPTTARAQGSTAATSAVGAAQALGIPAGSAIYNDIEAYPSNASCRAAVLSFLSGWTNTLHAYGYLAGVYSSGASGITDVAGAYDDPSYTRVDHIWFAWWNNVANTDAGPYVPAAYWADHQRLHQYAGDVYETWGGVQIRIDRNYLDVSTGADPPAWSSTVDNTTSGRFTASANWGTSSYSGQRFGADYRFANPTPTSDVAWYRVAIPETATYEVAVWYPANPEYNDSTPYIVAATGGNRTVRVDQRVNGGQWVPLGVFTLAAGDANRVGVSRWTAGTGYVMADAVRITRRVTTITTSGAVSLR